MSICSLGIVCGSKTREYDLIVYATGFSIEESICGFRTEGRNGKILSDYFSDHPCAYLVIDNSLFP